MAESFVRDESGYARSGDYVVLAGDYGLCRREHFRFMYELIDLLRKLADDFADGRIIRTLSRENKLVLSLIKSDGVAVYVGIILIEKPVGRNEKLVHFEKRKHNYGVDYVFRARKNVTFEIRREIDERFVVVFIEIAFPYKRLYHRLVPYRSSRNGFAFESVAYFNLGKNPFRKRVRIAVYIAERVFVKLSAVIHLDDESALRIRAFSDVRSASVHPYPLGPDIRAEYAYVSKTLPEPFNEAFAVGFLTFQIFTECHIF